MVIRNDHRGAAAVILGGDDIASAVADHDFVAVAIIQDFRRIIALGFDAMAVRPVVAIVAFVGHGS